MKKIIALALVFAMMLAVVPASAAGTLPTRDEVVSTIEQINDYWQSTYKSHGRAFWDNAAYHTGNIEAYALTGVEAYRDYSEAWAKVNSWKGATSNDKASWKYGYDESPNGVLFGDWQCCFQTYCDLYTFDAVRDENKVARPREVMEYEMSTAFNGYWWWADGLYMVMPVMAKLHNVTGNSLYLDKLYEYFKFAKELMYDGPDGLADRNASNWDYLFYRDGSYVKSVVNGVDNFWARGDGWVFAALAKVLQDTPDSWEHRDYFLNTYKEMAGALKAAQKFDNDGNGFWTQSILAHDYSVSGANPMGYETSGTAFFTYGFLWGINSGTLDENTYIDTALAGYNYLTKVALRDDGLVGYVQPIGGEATNAADRNYTTNFGVGATLLALCEMAKYVGGMEGYFYPYLQRRLLNTVSLKIDSPYVYADSAISQIDENNASVVAFIKDSRTLVPVRVISEKFGASVDWDGATRTVTAKSADGSIDVSMVIGESSYTVNGEVKTLDVAPEIFDGRTFIPLRAMAEALGKEVYWNNDERLIVIGYKQNVFYGCEANMIKMLGSILATGEYPENNPAVKDFRDEGFRDAAAISPKSVTGTYEPENFNPITAAIDGDLGTRWACNQNGESITVDFGESVYLEKVGVSFWIYEQRETSYELFISTDGTNFTKAFSGRSPMGVKWSVADINADARYVKLVGYGNNTTDKYMWTNVLELVGYGKGTQMKTTAIAGEIGGGGAGEEISATTADTPSGTKVSITSSMIKASAEPQAENSAANAIDGNPDTYWAVEGANNYVVDLGSEKNIASVGVIIRKYDDPNRKISYSIEVSRDGSSYTKVFSGSTAASQANYAVFDGSYRYVRFVSNENGWASFAEFEVYTK